MTAPARPREELPKLAAVPSCCPLPHRGRDVVLPAGLSAAAFPVPA